MTKKQIQLWKNVTLDELRQNPQKAIVLLKAIGINVTLCKDIKEAFWSDPNFSMILKK